VTTTGVPADRFAADRAWAAFLAWLHAYRRVWRGSAVNTLLVPVLNLLALGYGLGTLVNGAGGIEGVPYAQFLAPGLLAVFPMFTAVFECAFGSFVRLQMQGTYHAIVATPVSVDDVVAGDMTWGMTRSTITATWILIVLMFVTYWEPVVRSPWALLIAPLSLLPGLLFASISMCFVSVAKAMTHFSYFFNLVVNPMFWFGGAFFPFEAMPRWAQTVGWFIPSTHVVSLYRALLAGNLGWPVLGDSVWLLVATASFFFIALAAMRRRLSD